MLSNISQDCYSFALQSFWLSEIYSMEEFSRKPPWCQLLYFIVSKFLSVHTKFSIFIWKSVWLWIKP